MIMQASAIWGSKMKKLQQLFTNNQNWVKSVLAEDPQFFKNLKDQQAPEYLWIGCSDSRVPANQITGLAPGEIFVHRNIANVVVHTDLNSLSVIQFAVDLLKVKHVIVVGHYGCSGVQAALNKTRVGISDNWLRHVQDVHERHAQIINLLPTDELRHDRLCELNVVEQVVNVCRTTIVQDAWAAGQDLTVHGWVYGVNDGLINDLGFSVANNNEFDSLYRSTLKKISVGNAGSKT